MEVQTQPNSNIPHRSASSASTKVADHGDLSRGGTLRKRQSLKRGSSLKRSNSTKSVTAGSIRALHRADDEYNSVFHTPIPTSGNPTEVLVNRFQAWRKVIKDLVSYFGEIQSSYEHRSKSLLKVSNVLNNTTSPPTFSAEGGLDEANRILRGFHKHSVSEATKSKEIESDVITQLNGLRSDLSQKIKEIKSLSGDFKNSVEREKDASRKAVTTLQESLTVSVSQASAATGKNDPFIARLAVDRQIEKQIDEENYLHRAYINLESSGRELESIVVGEIQKAHNAFAGILKREADSAYGTIEELRSGPVTMPKDREWDKFVEHEPHVVNPKLPLRRLSNISYPEKLNPAAAEIRGGLLERKSKYLKSYSPGWYVLSPTHLHEFKSGDHIQTQQPVMSLYLLDQKLGSRSQSDASSQKFSLKGRQTGGVHRGHSWVFRAESYDTMMAWYEDIRNLTEKTGAERTAFVRKHARSVSGGSHSAQSVSSDGMDEDEADEVPYAAQRQPLPEIAVLEPPPKRPDPGGRFPSDINVNRDRSLQAPTSPSSDGSSRRNENIDNSSSDPEQKSAELEDSSIVGLPIIPGPAFAKPPEAVDITADGLPKETYASESVVANVEPYPNARQYDDPLFTPPGLNGSTSASPGDSALAARATGSPAVDSPLAGVAHGDASKDIHATASSLPDEIPKTSPTGLPTTDEPTNIAAHIPGAYEE